METFSNPPVAWDKIPKHGELSLQKIEPAYLKLMLISRSFFCLVLIIGFGVFLYFTHIPHVLWLGLIGGGLILVFLFISLFTAKKSFDNMGFGLRAHDFVFRKGWLFENLHIVPLKRIQHCQVKQGPLDRRFGLASIKMYTAGGTGADLSVHGLSKATAEQLKDWLMNSPENRTPKNIALDDNRLG